MSGRRASGASTLPWWCLGDPGALPCLVDRLASLPSGALGIPVAVTRAGTESRPADPTWSARVQAVGGRRAVVSASPRAPAEVGACVPRERARCEKRPRPLPLGPSLAEDDEGGDGGVVDVAFSSVRATPGRAPSHHAPAPPVDARMTEVLSACVRRYCGLPSSTPIGRHASMVSAVMVGDPESRSRAILLRVGSGKADAAILWCSYRGGILCLCFSGTHNALFLSASSRSCLCQHTTALRTSLSKNGIPFATFWRRMHLDPTPASFVGRHQYGPMRFWVVLYRSVFSLVTFTAGQVATCIAPSCRRFRARCGHVVLSRPLNAERRAAAASDAAMAPAAKIAKDKPAAVDDGPTVPRGPDDEDAGIESEPGDTERSTGDAAEATVAARVRRNLLPCVGEIKAGAVWARTADWRALFLGRCSSAGGSRASDLEVMSNLVERSVRLGMIHPRTFVPVERFCGSCGRMREERHGVKKERAVLYTHHPTAPVIEVSWRGHCLVVLACSHAVTILLMPLVWPPVACAPITGFFLTLCSVAVCL